MIQLANDPNARRLLERAAANESDTRDRGAEGNGGRAGRAWPFPSRYASQHTEHTEQPRDSAQPLAARSGS